MKIGCMTWFHYCNYGTALQIVALSQYLKTKGHDPEVINYVPTARLRNRKNNNGTLTVLSGYLKSYYYRTYITDEIKNEFDDFIKKNLHFSQNVSTFSDMRNLALSYDAILCGSDQIWSPRSFNAHYFLDFVEDTNKIIAYAPSLGVSKIDDDNTSNNIAKLASRFNYLSCREDTGAEILSKLTQKDVSVVCDPTFLLNADQWRNLESTKFVDTSKRYVLVYMLGQNENYWKYVYSISESLGLDVKVIPVFRKDIKRKGCITSINIGPAEFLELIDKAAFVCTDSFHGTAFALNFHVPFITFERFSEKKTGSQNSRIYSILKITGLQDRLFNKNNYRLILNSDIDYDAVQEELDKYKEISEKYLYDSLSSVESSVKVISKNVNRVTSMYCCGCGACAVVCPKQCISIITDSNGFQTAQIDNEKCVNCGKCKSICPFYNDKPHNAAINSELYSYKDYSAKVLQSSSSGGAAYRLSKYLIERGYAIAGCIYDKSSAHSRHVLIKPDEIDKLYLFQGSKYIQSIFAEAMNDINNYSGPVAIFGTPCQIAGARKLFCNRSDIVYIDLICHGVPSYLLFQKYLEYISSKYTIDITNANVDFRMKSRGWRERHIMVSDEKNQVFFHQDKDLFFSAFELGQCYSRTCYECRWRDGSEADIRLGDYWHKRFIDDKTGVSMVMAYTDEGKDIIKALSNEGELHIEKSDDYYACQQSKNAAIPVYYDELLNALKNKDVNLTDIHEKYMKKEMSRRVLGKKISPVLRCIKKYAKK